MKRVKTLLGCTDAKIKNLFSINQKNDNNHACGKLKEMQDEKFPTKEIEEYALNYMSTTRWQTI